MHNQMRKHWQIAERKFERFGTALRGNAGQGADDREARVPTLGKGGLRPLMSSFPLQLLPGSEMQSTTSCSGVCVH